MTLVQEKEREKDEEKEKEKEKEEKMERKDSTRSTRSTRKEREREREKEKDRDKHRERDGDREKRRSRDHDRDRDHDKHRRDKGKEREHEHEHEDEKKYHHDSHKDNSKTVAAYTPEFLHALAKSGSPTKADFDVISGAEAVKFASKFLREQAADGAPVPAALSAAFSTPSHAPSAASHTSHTSHAPPRSTSLTDHPPGDADNNRKLKRSLQPVVFALPRSAAGDAGRRVVDFYMSWRGKTKTHPLTGRARRTTFLDSEFRRVREALDGEWKRASRALKGAVGGADDSQMDEPSGPVMLARAPTDPQPLPRLPPMLAQYARREHDQNGEGGLTAPPAARSVSDPLPGPSSSPYPLPSSFPINTERPMLGTHRGSVDSLTSVTSLPLLGMIRGVPVGNRVRLRVTNPGDRMSMSSSSDSIAEVPTPKPTKSSPLRDGVAFDVPSSDTTQDNANAETHMLQLPGRTVSDSSASSGGSSKSWKSKSSRKKTSRVKDEDKILIVLLDEKDKPKDNKGEKKVPLSDDDTTWHGLERRLSTRPARKPSPPVSAHDSPWLGPLVNLDEDITYIPTPDHSDYYSDSDSEDDDEHNSDWPRKAAGGVVPIKNLLSAMGYLTPEAAVFGGTPSPYGSYTALPTTYTPYNSPYAGAALAAYSSPYVSPQMQGSPYQLQLQPPSRPRTPVGYGTTPTPPMPMAQPAWSSPGAVYPPTVYNSPAPAGYASPYAPASPLAVASLYAAASPVPVGYASPYPPASPATRHASPAGGYPSSPYI